MAWGLAAEDDFDGVQYDGFYDGPAGEWRGRCGRCGRRDCCCVPAEFCVICGAAASNGQRASIGDRSGVACVDCASWCDGNLTGE